jgi:hypothetical protein
MENLSKELNKYQVTIHFKMDEESMKKLPEHRSYINSLIENNIIEYYTVSIETMRVWVMINAEDKEEVTNYLIKSPLYKYWKVEIDELYVYDGQTFRLPALQFN